MAVVLSGSEEKIYRLWEQFVKNGDVHPEVRPEVARSWQRCRQWNITNERPEPVYVSAMELAQILKERRLLIEVARPFMEHLYSLVKGSGFLVVLTDEHAVALEVLGEKETMVNTLEGMVGAGRLLGEKEIGTASFGLVIEEGTPVQVFAAEHYCRAHHRLTCSGAPIYGPEGELLGVMDMTGYYRDVNSHTLGMVVAAARAIENEIRLRLALEAARTADKHSAAIVESVSEGLISIDQGGRIVRLNQNGAKILGLKPREALGKDAWTVLGEDCALGELLAAGGGFRDRELYWKPAGKQIRVSADARPVVVEGVRKGVVCTFREFKHVRGLVNRMTGAVARFTFDELIGQDRHFRQAVTLARRATEADASILLQGESGTGKEMFAQAVHNGSARAAEPFVAINCASIPRALIESELFGYEDGAFTGAKKGGQPGKFELADGGTIFLDEIGDMPIELQASLLRVLETREVVRLGGSRVIPVDVRVIAATHRDLEYEVAAGNFRGDLYYRLAGFVIHIPPLRERGDDVLILADHALKVLEAKRGRPAGEITPEVRRLLIEYKWPGNVRELFSRLEQAVQLSSSGLLDPALLPRPAAIEPVQAETEIRPLEAVERDAIFKALQTENGNVSRAAQALAVSRNTLYNKLKKYGLEPPFGLRNN